MSKLPIKISLDDSFFVAEQKCGFQVTAESKRLWAVLLDLMVEFDAVCKKHDIKYSLDGGTFLGAVRHKGFIPWDNDVDVIMFRKEYERLCKIAPSEFKAPYFWQTNETDPGSVRRHGQLRNSMTTCILKDESENGHPRFGFNQGAFLDVFILDEVPDDDQELTQFRRELEKKSDELWVFREYYWDSGQNEWIADSLRQAFIDFETVLTRYQDSGQKCVCSISLLPQRLKSSFFAKDLYEDLIDYTFEGFTFPAPRDYDTILSGLYGDWHKYIIGTETHGGFIMDMEKPYTEYLKERCHHSIMEADLKKHPILALYQERDMLLDQRNTAWADIRQKQSKLKRLRRKLKMMYVLSAVLALFFFITCFVF